MAEARGVKAGTLIHAVRVAVTGTAVSPGLFEVVALVGRARVHARLAPPSSALRSPAGLAILSVSRQWRSDRYWEVVQR